VLRGEGKNILFKVKKIIGATEAEIIKTPCEKRRKLWRKGGSKPRELAISGTIVGGEEGFGEKKGARSANERTRKRYPSAEGDCFLIQRVHYIRLKKEFWCWRKEVGIVV